MGDASGVVALLMVFGPGIIITAGIAFYLVKRASGTRLDRETLESIHEINRRLAVLEGRVDDLQDIVITVDEKMKRTTGA